MPQPLKCFTIPIRLTNGSLPADVPKTFILSTKNQGYHEKQAQEIREDSSWRYFEIDNHHDAMFEDPEGLVQILIQ